MSTKSDSEAAALIDDIRADIAVDLTGYTDNCRPGILALRPAPIQMSFLGFPATMGVPHVDYVIADDQVLPAGSSEAYFSENIVRLPNSFFAQRLRPVSISATPTRAEAGCRRRFVFCCFNNRYKIMPDVFAVWTRLLMVMCPAACYGLPAATNNPRLNLRVAAQAHGIAPERLVLATRVASLQPDHLARHQLADLLLDTLPYNAHSTAADALWAGLPVLTCKGSTFAGRVAASLLSAIGLQQTNRRSTYTT